MKTNLKRNFDEWLRYIAKNMQLKVSHLTPREQQVLIVTFWLLSLALSYYLLLHHINS